MKDTTKTSDNKAVVSKRGKQNGYSNATLHAKSDARRKAAEARNAEHDSLTTKEKIEKAKSRRGNSLGELARLKDQLFKENLALSVKAEAKAVKVSVKKAVKA